MLRIYFRFQRHLRTWPGLLTAAAVANGTELTSLLECTSCHSRLDNVRAAREAAFRT
jgi:hypothetical protein